MPDRRAEADHVGSQRTVLIDRRTGSTTLDLWPGDRQPSVRDTRDIDDWLAIIAAGSNAAAAMAGRKVAAKSGSSCVRPNMGR